MPDDLFRTAPKEVRDYLDRRGLKASWRWTDVAPHEHALAFTVARTAGYDVLADLRAAVRQAIIEQLPFEDFRKGLEPTLKAKGWWGRAERAGESVQLGSTRRLRTIYWANLRSAHAAGEWARTQTTKDVLPFLRYKISLAREKRDEHLSWVGITLPVDHPWWRTHYPPNGWGCQCRVEQISAPMAERSPPDRRTAPPLRIKLWRDKASGRVMRVPTGIDPGWQTNPGLTRERVAAALQADRLGLMGDVARATALADWRAGAAFRHVAGNAVGLPYPMPRGRTPQQAREARATTPVAAIDAARAAELGVRTVALLSGEDAAKLAHPSHAVRLDQIAIAERLIAEGIARRQVNGKIRIVGLIDGQAWAVIIKTTARGETLVNSMHRIDSARFEAWSRDDQGPG